jgi:tetratricopeptide (TPR) repeat protein
LSPATPPRPEAKAARRRINFRALAILAAVLVLGGGTVAALAWLRPKGGPDALAEAERLLKDKRPDLAMSYLTAALERNPYNIEALNLKARLLADGPHDRANTLEALKLGDLALRQIPVQEDAPEELEPAIRRRQIRLNLELGRLETASALLEPLLKAEPDDPELLQMAAPVQEVLAAGNTPGAVAEAIDLYARALAADPKNLAVATRLAALRLGREDGKDDPAGGLAVLDALAAADPESVGAQLARNRYLAALARRARAARGEVAGRDEAAWYAEADAAMARALELDPKGTETLLAAAEYSLMRDRPEVARAHLQALPKEAQQDQRALNLKGFSYARENRPDLAIADWRSGLLASHGTDADLTLRLAILQLKMDHLAEAEPLIEQYRRLTGTEKPTPASLYLEGLRLLKQNKADAAIAKLEEALVVEVPPNATREAARLLTLTPALRAEIEFALGQAHEATRDQERALEHYDAAILADANQSAPRLARIRVLQQVRPEQARLELDRASAALGEDPALLVARARQELRDQLGRPEAGRDFAGVQALADRAAKAAPASPDLVRLQADLMLARDGAGKLDEALGLLERATALQPGDAELWLARVTRLEQAGRLDQALVVLEQAMAPGAVGDQAGLRIARARILTRLGRGQEARTGLVADLDRLPADQQPVAWAALGDLYTAQRNPAEARRAYQRWADLLPSDPVPRLFLLDLALAREDAGDADAQVAKLKELSGGGGIYYRIARAQELLRQAEAKPEAERGELFDEATTLIDAIQKDAPDQRYAPMLRGQLLLLRGQKAEAADAFAEALKRDGGQIALARVVALDTELGRRDQLEALRRDYGDQLPSLDRTMAEAALRQGDKAQAEAIAARLAAARPDDFETRLWQARLLNTLGKGPEAIAVLRDAVRQKPEALNARLALLYFLAGLDKPEEAAAAVEDLIQNVKDLPRPELTHAQAWRIAGRNDKADAAYEAALARWPDDPNVVRNVADYYEATARLPRAERVLRDAMKAHADWRWCARALALLRSNHPGDLDAWREARALVEAAPESQADGSEERLTRGIVLARSPEPQDREAAVAILDALVLDLPADYPSSAAARGVLEALHLRAGRFDRAAAVAAINAGAPNSEAKAVARYAELLILAKQYDEADAQLDRLDTLLATTPADLIGVLLRARLLAARDRKAEAVSALRQAFDERQALPESAAIGRRLLGALLEVDPAAGEEFARRLAGLDPKDQWLVAAALAREDRPDEALAALKDAIPKADEPSLPEIGQLVLGLVAPGGQPRDADHLARAEPLIDAIIARKPDAPELQTLKGYLRHFQQKYDPEVAVYQEILKRKPDEPTFLNNLAWSLCEGLGKPQEALPLIERAIGQAKAPLPQYLDTRGVILTRLDRLDEAVRDLEQAARGRPSPAILAHLARAYHKAGQAEKFEEVRQRLRDLKLTPEALEPTDRADLVTLLLGDASKP